MCKNVIVNIENYNPQIIYQVFIRKIGSGIAFASIPSNTKIATGNQVIFENLADEDYEIGIRANCTDGSSDIKWIDAYDKNCALPKVVFNTPDIEITLPSITAGYEWRIDNNPWTKVESNATVDHTLDITTARGDYDGYGDARVNSMLDFQFRTICAAGSKSAIQHFYNIETPIADTVVTLVEVLCEGGKYKGLLLRATMGDESNTPEIIRYDNDPSSDIDLLQYTRNLDNDLDIAVYRNFFNGFNPIRIIDISTPGSPAQVSFDFILKQAPQSIPETGDIPCGAYLNPILIIT